MALEPWRQSEEIGDTVERPGERRGRRAGVAAVLVALFVAVAAGACSDNPHQEEVSSSSVSYEWPLTVESGELECLSGSAVVFHGGGTTWAVNGAAQARDYPEIRPIWRDHPDPPGSVEGLKVNIGPMIDQGLSLCD